MDFIDPVLDLLEFIILLAGVCFICISITLTNNKNIQNVVYDKPYDKTVSLTQGEKPLDEIIVNEVFTKQEIAMSIASQNSYIASPHESPNIENPYDYQVALEFMEDNKDIDILIKIGYKKIVLNGRAQYDTATATEVLNAINNWEASNTDKDIQGYRIMFYMNDIPDTSDNMYALYYLDSNNKYHLCD